MSGDHIPGAGPQRGSAAPPPSAPRSKVPFIIGGIVLLALVDVGLQSGVGGWSGGQQASGPDKISQARESFGARTQQSDRVGSDRRQPTKEMIWRAWRAEVPSYVDGIKTAQIAYDAMYDTYIQVTSFYPRPTSQLNSQQASWPSGSSFDDLGWAPDGKVRGSYRVLSTSSTDFLVTGMIDADGDGNPAVFTATKSINTTMVTPAGVY